jgi:hypothetical protein
METPRCLTTDDGLRKCGVIYNAVLFSHKEE